MRRSATRATGQRVHSLHTHTRAEKKGKCLLIIIKHYFLFVIKPDGMDRYEFD